VTLNVTIAVQSLSSSHTSGNNHDMFTRESKNAMACDFDRLIEIAGLLKSRTINMW